MSIIELDIPNFPHQARLKVRDNHDLVSQRISQDRIWEVYETKLIVDHLKCGDTFVDVGANLGYYSVVAGLCVGAKGKVLSFEPEHSNSNLLQENIQLNLLDDVVAVFPFGLSNSNESKTLYLSKDNYGDHRTFDFDDNRQPQIIELKSGDELKDLSEHPFHFLKLDTQGSELKILKGLKESLERNIHHLYMIIELWPFALRENGDSEEELLNLLEELPVDIFLIDHINHQLDKKTANELREWVRQNLDPKNQGFANLFIKPKS